MGLFGFGKKKESSHLDFSDIDTFEKIETAVKSGRLVQIYLISPEFGGAENASNAVFVPPFASSLKDKVDDLLYEALSSGKKVSQFHGDLAYKGNSRVPSQIKFTAGGDISLDGTINIW